MTGRLPDGYFDEMYAAARDPWRLEERWYDQRKYAITMAMLPRPRYRHAFEPGCSVGVLTALLSQRCDRVTATDVAAEALESARGRLAPSGRSDAVTLLRSSLDAPWPSDVDLVVLSEVGYYLDDDVVIGLFSVGATPSVAASTEIPGAFNPPEDH